MELTALMYATQLLGSLPALIAAGQSVVGLVEHGNEALKRMQDEKRDPTQAEWDALDAKTKELQAELHAK